MRHWFVTTPEITDYYQDEPPETYFDYVSVSAPNKKKARVEAVRKFREKKSSWINGDNPFTGLKVESAKCPHGNCWCDICVENEKVAECAECLKEWEESEKNY